MATYVVNEVETALGESLPEGDNAFTDDDGNVHEPNINKLANNAIILGIGGDEYDPFGNVNRGQMATFIANAIDYHDDQTVESGDDNSVLPSDPPNAFTDDDSNVHHLNINRLADAMIVVGTGEDEYSPSNDVTRAQMATFIMHMAEFAAQNGLWAPTAEASNQTFDVTPDELQNVTLATEPSTDDDVVFTVSNAVADAEHQLALVAAADITVDDDGVYTFAETAQEADLTAASADITVVNGAPVGTPDATASVTPSGSSFDFRVDPDINETFWVVVYFDAESSGSLTTDADGLPVDAEPFGIGGPVNADPAEAASNADYASSGISELDTDSNKIVTDADNTFFYDDNDTYTIDGNQANFAGFEAAVNVGDDITVTDYQQDPSLNSTFALINNVPDAPNNVPAENIAGQQSYTFTFDNIVDDATVTAYYTEDTATPDAGNPALDTDTFDSQSFTEDGDADDADYQITVDGLDAGTDYQFYFVQEDASGESAATAGLEVATDADAVPTADTAFANDINDGVGSTNEVVVEFSEAVTVSDATLFTFDVGDFTINGVSAEVDNEAGARWVITVDQTLNDASTDVTYTANVEADAFVDATGNDNVAAAAFDTFDY